MTSISSNRRRSYAPDLTIDTPSLSEIQTDRQTRSMYKTSPDQAAPSSKRTRRSTTVSSNSSEDGDSVRLTKTGRISRALKGQPVHKCDACYKVRLDLTLAYLSPFRMFATRYHVLDVELKCAPTSCHLHCLAAAALWLIMESTTSANV